MLVKVKTLEGKTFELTFDDDITVNKIRQKLLSEFNLNTDRCYFCKDGKILENETIPKESFISGRDTPIVIFNYQVFPDKSFPKVDSAFQINFSRYSDTYINHRPISTVAQSEVSSIESIDHLIRLGIIPPNGPIPHTIRIIRNRPRNSESRNNNNHAINSESDDEDEHARLEHLNQHGDIMLAPGEDLHFDIGSSRPIRVINSRSRGGTNILFPMDDAGFDVPLPNIANRTINLRLNANRNPLIVPSQILPGIFVEQATAQPRLPQQQQIADEELDELLDQQNQLLEMTNNQLDNNIELLEDADNFDQTNREHPQNHNNFINETDVIAHLENQLDQIANTIGRAPPQTNTATTAVNTTAATATTTTRTNYQPPQQQPPRPLNQPPRGSAAALLEMGRRENELNLQIIEALNLNVQLSEDDNRAISRLVHSGYDRATVIQVFEACDRNEEATLNLLVAMG